jgi:hypothetical protein
MPAPRNRSENARELFASMGYKPVVAETDALLEQMATAPSR